MEKSADNTNSIASMAYDAAAAYARLRASIGLFITFIIFCITLSIGYGLYKKEELYENNLTKGIVQNSICGREIQNRYDCSINLLYNIDNNEYAQNYRTSSTKNYSPGELIDLRYNKNNKNDITTDTSNSRWSGIMIMIFGLFLLIIISLYTYSVFTWKIVAVADTASNLAGNFASSIGFNNGMRRNNTGFFPRMNIKFN